MRRMTSGVYFDAANKHLLSLVVAYTVEETVAIGRQFGIQFPREYDVGVRLDESAKRDGGCIVAIRVNETRRSYNMFYSWANSDAFFADLHRNAAETVNHWIRDNPTFTPDNATIAKFVAQMKSSATWRGEVIERAKRVAATATFQVRK